ncbi:MAG: class I SAM-dependent methyltransferase, partial [Acidimicrobiales bacterium]
RALAQHRLKAAGLDISETFIRLAAESRPEGAAFIRGDVRRLPIRPSSVDAVICLCQGGFGLLGGEGDEVAPLAEMAGALRPGGRIALSAFSAYFAVRFKEEGDTFDADRGVNHERSDMVGSDGTAATYDLWTTCFTPRELRLMCDAAGLTVRHLWSVTPGRYRCDPPGLDQPELLLIADKA